jgi:hypothetical protein
MNKSYILIAIVIGLVLFRTREGFEDFTDATCPTGTVQAKDKCVNMSSPSIDPTCPTGLTLNEGLCRDANGDAKVPTCPTGTHHMMRKCYTGSTPVCNSNSEFVLLSTPEGRPEKFICLPKSRTTYEMTLPQGRPPTPAEMSNACRLGDRFIGKFTGLEGPAGIRGMCLQMSDPTPPPATTTPTTTGTTTATTGTTVATTTPTTTGTTVATTTPTTTATTAGAFEPRDTSSTTNAPVSSMADVIKSLKPFRPPTAPASDLEKERKEITLLSARNLYFIQIALFLVVLAMLSYFVLPLDTANLIAFALLSVGIAMGFFLRR